MEVVGAVIVNQEQEILCALRSQTMSLAGMWEFPGGKVELGETHEETLAREIREELGCDITVRDFVAECLHDYQSVKVHLYTYYARISAGTPTPQEHERLEWVPAERLRDLHWAPADLPTVDRVIQDFTVQSQG